MDEALFRKIVADAPDVPAAVQDTSGADQAGPPDAAASSPPSAPADPTDNSGAGANASYPPDTRPGAAQEAARLRGVDQGITDPSRTLLDAPVAGAAEAAFQTKDFVTGETPADQKSTFRTNVEATRPEDGIGYSLTKGLAQFGVGLLGAGKLIKAAEGVEAVGGALSAVRGARGGAMALESAKAAAVGAVAFDPHQERLSNLLQSSPALSNPVTSFLAARPGDSAAEGRLKNALESIGMDAALIGVIGATVKGYKAVSAWKNGEGTAAEAVKATDEVGAAMDAHNSLRDRAEGGAPSQDAATAAPAEAAIGDSAPPLTVIPKAPEAPATGTDAPATAAGEAPPPAIPETHTDLVGREFTREAPGQPWTAKRGEPANDNAGQPTGRAPIGDLEPAAPVIPEGAAPANPPLSIPAVLPEQARSIYEGAASDMDAFAHFGSWEGAIDGGHIFGKGGSIPYQKLAGGEAGRTELDAFITNTAEQLKEPFDAAKGGAVLSDARVDRLVQQRVQLYGEDPAALMGIITRAGQDANSLVANMEASYSVAQRGYQDAYALAARIKAGDLTGFSDIAGAVEGLRQRVEVAGSAWASGQAMRAASGRALRRMRSEFRLQPADVEAIMSLDDRALVELLNATGGEPRALKRATEPSFLRRAGDKLQFLYTNNLLWGLRTHFINFSTNLYMVAARPMERILGSLVQSHIGDADLAQAALLTRQQAAMSYAYMGATLHESWKGAYEAFLHGDSIMAPHGDELGSGGSHSLGVQVAQLQYRPWTSLANVTHNALMVAAPKTLGLPSRAIGAADELIKGISYRANIMSRAHVDGAGRGLAGPDLEAFVRDRLYAAFDDAGRATDAAMLNEAKIATFQQDLLPGTLGAGIQNLLGSAPWLRFILPFVKTPTNVLRYGIKMTPGLNLLQEEYREMIQGARGPEQQAQAMGQMAMGSLFMGAAAYLAHAGIITGGGPADPKLKASLQATGWRPYSFVKINPDGSRTYIPYGRFDPVAMPFGMVADIVDVLSSDPEGRQVEKAGGMLMALTLSLTKSFSEKTYMKSADDALRFALEPDHSFTRFAGQTTANFVPAASGLRQANPDPVMRDARNYLDYIKATIPGFSQTLPPKRDAFGDPITVHKGLWVDGKAGIVDAEMRRMAEKPGNGVTLGPPAPTIRGGVDLRDVTMKDGRNAYDVFQQYARQPSASAPPIKDVVGRLMTSKGYASAPDGDAQTKGTKLAIVTTAMSRYRHAAEKEIMADPEVRKAAYKKLMDVKAAYANRRSAQNPTPANAQNDALSKVEGAFGVR